MSEGNKIAYGKRKLESTKKLQRDNMSTMYAVNTLEPSKHIAIHKALVVHVICKHI